MRFSPCLVLLALPLACCGFAGAQKPRPSKAPANGKARLTPTLDRAAKSGVYIPKDLTDALREMRHMLPSEIMAQMKRGGENDMGRYHMGLGLWIRNNWGLWAGSRLAKWFNAQGIYHPDDMSGILLTSFWRFIHQKPVLLEAQIKFYQAYWVQARKAQQQEDERVLKVKAQIPQLMLGIQSGPGAAGKSVPTLFVPPQDLLGVRIRFAAPFFVGGGLITAKQNTGLKDDQFITPAYIVDIEHEQLRPVQIPEMSRIENAVVVDNGTTAYFHGLSATGGAGRRKDVLLELRPGGYRRLLPAPPGTGFIRLGIGTNHDLLAVRPQAVYRWRREKQSGQPSQQWERLYSGSAKEPLPRSGVPPQILGSRLYLRDEGYGEDDKRLSWLELPPSSAPLKSRPPLVYFDENTGMVGPYGPRWENVWSYAYDAGTTKNSPTGTLWISTGNSIGQASLLRWTPTEGYRIALFNGTMRFGGDFFQGGDLRENAAPDTFAVTGIEVPQTDVSSSSGGGLRVVGPKGLFELKGNQIQTLIRFTGGKDWIPTHLLTLRPGLTLLGGHFGGIYLLKEKAAPESGFVLVPLDAHLGPPIRL